MVNDEYADWIQAGVNHRLSSYFNSLQVTNNVCVSNDIS